MKRKVLSSLMVVLFVLFIVSCTKSWKGNTVTGYEITGTTIAQIGDTAKSMCDSGAVKASDCAKIKAVYNKARKAYIASGDALILAIKVEDDIQKKNAMKLYSDAINDLSKLLPQLVTLAGELGIKIK